MPVPTEAEHRQASYTAGQDQPEAHHGDPGPDTIDHTIEMPPAYLDNPSDTYEETPDTDDATEAAEDALEDATEALEKASDSAFAPVEKNNQLKVQTITSSEGKSIKHLMTSEPTGFVAPLPPTVVDSVSKPATAQKKKVTEAAKVVAPVKEVEKAVKEVINDIPELDLQQNDEVFGFGIE